MSQETSAALIDQLVYFDNFMLNADTPNLDLDGQLSLDLAAFADDDFVFADEDKPDPSNMSDFEDEQGADNRANPANNRPVAHGQNTNTTTNSNPVAFRDIDSGSSRTDDAFSFDMHDRPGSSSQALSNWFHGAQNGNADRQGSSQTNSINGGNAHESSRVASLHSDKIAAAKRNKYHHHVGHSSVAERRPGQNPNQTQSQAQSHGPSHRNDIAASQNHGPTGPNSSTQNISQVVNPSEFHFDNHQEVAPDVPENGPEHRIPDLSNLPKYPVPPGAENSLKKAGLSSNQINLLSALIAQHQTSLAASTPESGHLTRQKDASRPSEGAVVPTLVSHTPARVPTGHRDSVAEPSQFAAPGLAPVGKHGLPASIIESPASTYTSDHSNSSTISGAYSPYKEAAAGPTGGLSGAGAGGDDLSKRKRNTAASARFRVKKKMKEKEMEEKISQLSDTISRFEMRIDELEMENKFLKNLVIEKGNRQSDAELQLLKDKTGYLDTREGEGHARR